MHSPASDTRLRIAALQPSISIILDRLNALDTLVACTRYCVEAVPALSRRSLTIVKDSWSSTTEEILAARPNLVLACVPYRMESLAALLKSGCPVVTLAPHTLADIYADIRLLGSIVHRVEEAEALVSEMQQEIAATSAKTASDGPRPIVYCEEWGKPLIHSQPWVAELVDAAGGQFLGDAAKQTTAEAVATADPDAMVFCWCGAGDRVPLERVIARRGWQHLSAVRQGHIFCIADEWLNSPAPSILLGLRAIAAALHPSLFPEKERPRSIHTVAGAGITI
ncbi:MAG TPA: ABC transporter substrate-binding protein [Acidobacteriaceae bacterium]|jgi:iron complex transport system substrate-binding protein